MATAVASSSIATPTTTLDVAPCLVRSSLFHCSDWLFFLERIDVRRFVRSLFEGRVLRTEATVFHGIFLFEILFLFSL
jgi:hypothetical protein